ncbi:MAG: type II toxin-antitoxin system HicA family toxin [Bacteroidetes bacterium]|nr:MAG: type II toxin-antitoxin system HicA family toxin [Bacteroidota bacterium]
MPEQLQPLNRRELIRKLRNAGFDGPYPGGKHSCMIKGKHKIIVPNPHRGDIGVVLIRKIVNQLKLTSEEWNNL